MIIITINNGENVNTEQMLNDQILAQCVQEEQPRVILGSLVHS